MRAITGNSPARSECYDLLFVVVATQLYLPRRYFLRMAAAITTSLILYVSVAASAQKKTQEPDPIAWGALSGNSGCVIFAEGHKASGKFYGIAVTTKTIGKLTVVETQNYTLDQKEVLETQAN